MTIHNAAECVHHANSLFVDEEYENAIPLYSTAIRLQPNDPEKYIKRAAAYLKLNKLHEAVEDSNKAISLDPKALVAYYRKGVACFLLEDYESAKNALTKGLELSTNADANLKARLKTWIRKCDAELECDDDGPLDNTDCRGHEKVAALPLQANQTIQPQVQQQRDTQARHIRYDWYQTTTHVTINIMQKNLTEKDVEIDIQPNKLTAHILLNGEKVNVIDIGLYDEVVVEESSRRITPSKVEIKLKKKSSFQWEKLEFIKHHGKHTNALADIQAKPVKPYASSKNWDQIDREIKKEIDEEKPEGEAAMAKLFRDIYEKADEDTRRAMNKSFQTSGGTCLSTNWKEVKDKDYEGKDKIAPEGSEWKKWG